MHVLGIDAGGTKTVCLLADERGVIRRRRAAVPARTCTQRASSQVEKIAHRRDGGRTRRSRDRAGGVCLGIAGVDRDDESRTVRAIMRRIGPRLTRRSSSTTR